MCGYARRHIGSKELRQFVDLIHQPQWQFSLPEDGGIQHFYAAHGGAANKKLKDVVIRENGQDRMVDATWWYSCYETESGLAVDNEWTTFNARNLHQTYWKPAINHHRGIFLVTGLGEGKEVVEGTKTRKMQYLVESEKPILMGCVYKPFSNGCYSAAIITRNKHPRFDKYHDKAFPLMLPHDPDFINLWLSDAPADDPAIADLLEHPKIFNDLRVTRVKTFVGGIALDETEFVAADT